MRYRDTLSSLLWLVAGMIFFTGAFRYGFMRGGIPGAGLFPFLASLALVCLSLIALTRSLWEIRVNRGEKPTDLFTRKEGRKTLALALVGLFGYWLLLSSLGFLPTTLLFMLFLLKFVKPQRWVMIVITSILTTGLSYLVFKLWLKVPLPKGIFGF